MTRENYWSNTQPHIILRNTLLMVMELPPNGGRCTCMSWHLAVIGIYTSSPLGLRYGLHVEWDGMISQRLGSLALIHLVLRVEVVMTSLHYTDP